MKHTRIAVLTLVGRVAQLGEIPPKQYGANYLYYWELMLRLEQAVKLSLYDGEYDET